MESKKAYEAPRLTVVSVKAEKGYALSVEMMLWVLSQHGEQHMEAYETGNGWDSGNTSFWS